MNSDIGSPTLGEYLAKEALVDVVTKKWSSGYEVRGSHVVMASMWVFQKGAIFGRAKTDRIKELAKLVAQEGCEENICEFFKSTTESMLEEYGKEPSNFLDFFLKTTFPGVDLTNIDTLRIIQEQKHRLGEILPRFQTDVAAGIGFGALRPELVEKMWVEMYETDIAPEARARAQRAGLDIPEEGEHFPLDEMEERVLQEVSAFVREYRPSLIEPLGLRLPDK